MKEIRWGIIGCGDVTEVKSGPAFNKVPNSALVAVMRRDASKAEDYARRHKVPHWYSDADALLGNPAINAIYIATPPSSHETYSLASIARGRYVYLEKPMSVDYPSAKKIANFADERKCKLCVAHYRRQQPVFLKVKELLGSGAIGKVLFAELKYSRKALTSEELKGSGKTWRVNSAISGGGLFHDLAPHQLDLARYFFGDVISSAGISINQSQLYNAADVVAGTFHFKNDILFNGTWRFNCAPEHEADLFEIYGLRGKLSFPVFGDHSVTLENENGKQIFIFDKPRHVQQNMIAEVVKYFLERAENPCSGFEGAEVMKMIDAVAVKACV